MTSCQRIKCQIVLWDLNYFVFNLSVKFVIILESKSRSVMKIIIEYDKSINIRRDEELKVRKRKGEQ